MKISFRHGSIALLALAGCAAPGPGYVVRDWSANLRELGIYPLFPPQENVCAGDVYVSPAPETDSDEVVDPDGFVPIGNLFASVPYGAALDVHYGGRGRLPTTPASGVATEDTQGGGCGANPQNSLLRLVAFPLFVRAQITANQLGAYVPADAYTARLGAGASMARGASVSVSSGEAYGLPLETGLAAFTQRFNIRKGALPPETLELLHLARQGQPGASKSHVMLTLVNEVYYARVFDVSLYRASKAGLDSVIAPATAGALQEPAASAPLPAAAVPVKPAASSAREAVQDTASGGEAGWTTLPSRSSPGVNVQVISTASGDVALRATYNRPIAIGYRGMRWRVSLTDGQILPAPPPSGANYNDDIPEDAVAPVSATASGAPR